MTTHNVLILCTGNSARSIIGEVLVNDLGRNNGQVFFRGYSAGADPTGRVNSHALAILREKGHDTTGLRSKGWEEFTGDGAPRIDFVFTVCDNAARQPCPVFPGPAVRSNWPIPDPAAAQGSDADIRAAFLTAYEQLHRRITAFMALPLDELDDATLHTELTRIAHLP